MLALETETISGICSNSKSDEGPLIDPEDNLPATDEEENSTSNVPVLLAFNPSTTSKYSPDSSIASIVVPLELPSAPLLNK